MTTRLLVLVALFVVSGCYGPVELPQAPEPRPNVEKICTIPTFVLARIAERMIAT